MGFARRLFRIAGIVGLAVLVPQYFLERRLGADDPPAITHPEYFYGFLGVAVAWQIAFLMIARDPARYRPLMIAGALEKAGFGLAAVVLFALRRTSAVVFGFGLVDLVWGALFLIAHRRTRPTETATMADAR